ncbi:potassium channel, putative [Plasmodium knowlesi strain H]|uniref:Potassium channel, putative n=3 Tax=Plasmodium knowlesi TaxID=5850 RepID=A0A5K1VMT2_PLAKH|nr:potassium channel K2, putative [Plasmodium knowlesi strain H]OTN65267.1 putative Calcium/potassium channel [Plasmodium knowlesi]CAA9989486.1 potassium channel K2, putative [Plasmodium knowlesi strain H]SBO25155.1 potassium channel, putative [Plasmodium knowlesi strain H]SBO27786.1 potassium channel, putative [Plasmodium knowlesi strain H]VVS78960.1 potassium channel K2, putative [Plasmodium knowlesi strain H]|eukprot:XP_002260211.1 Calcium/potassium channel, putative [Plasmodium knowlesi strain H]
MKSGLMSINDVLFLMVNIFKYFLIALNGLYLYKLPSNAKENIDFVSAKICILTGVTIKIIVIAIYCTYFMDTYMFRKCRRNHFLKLCNFSSVSRRGNISVLESDDFEYKKLIKKFFFKKVYYSLRKKHKNMELYMLKIYNSTFNYYFCNMRDVLYAFIWYISLYYWRRDTYDKMWNFDNIPTYIHNILIVLLSSSYIDLVMVILSYSKSKYYVMKSKFLIDAFFSAPSVFFFSKYLFVLDNKIDIYFIMGFLRNIKIFLNVSYVRVEQNSILTNTEIRIVRIVLGVLLLCNAFASTVYTIQAIHPYNLENGNFSYFLNTYLDYFYFSIISISTVGYGDIFPINKLSKVVCIIFIFWTFIWVPIQFNDLIISIFSKKKTYGKLSMNSQKFILLIGEVEPQKLNVFLFESIAYGNKIKFHILTTYPISCYKEQIKIADHFCISLYIKSYDLNEKQNTNLLYSINAQNAYYLFLFSDKFNNGHYNIDTKSFTRLLILKKFLHGKKNAVIELRNKSVSNVVKSIGCENFIIDNLKHSLIVKNVKYPGIITLILNLFTAYKYEPECEELDDVRDSSCFKYISQYIRGSRTKIFSFFVHKNMVGLKFDKLFYKLYESLGIILIGVETDNGMLSHIRRNYTAHKVANFLKGKKARSGRFKVVFLNLLRRYSHSCNPVYIQPPLREQRGILNSSRSGHTTGRRIKRSSMERSNLLKMNLDYQANRGKGNSSNLIGECGTYHIRENKVKDNVLHRRRKNKYESISSEGNICINISRSNIRSNKLRERYTTKEEPHMEELKKWDYNIIHAKTNNKWGYDTNISKNTKQLKCYLNLLGANYSMRENDKCVVIANSKKVIKYLSMAKSLFWLFEIKSKKEKNISYDLKSVIKTKKSFNKYLTPNLRRNMPTMSPGHNGNLVYKDANLIAINYHDLFSSYKISTAFSKRNYPLGERRNTLRCTGGHDSRDSHDLVCWGDIQEKCVKNGDSQKGNYQDVTNCDRSTHAPPYHNNNSVLNGCNFITCIPDRCNIDTRMDRHNEGNILVGSSRYLERTPGKFHVGNPTSNLVLPYPEVHTFENAIDKAVSKNSYVDPQRVPPYHTEVRKKYGYYFIHKKKLKKKNYLINYVNFLKREETGKDKVTQNGLNNAHKDGIKDALSDNFNATFKSAIAYSYEEACEKYFPRGRRNKLLLIINFTSNTMELIKMLNHKCTYNVVILTDEVPVINMYDLCKYNVVFIKCKSLDDYNILKAGLMQAYYIIILPTDINNADEINETDMNNIILTRKMIHLMRKRKKSFYINNIMTELINPSNIIFLEENKMIKLKDNKSSYSDFFPYVNCCRFYSSNLICETMLYNFMAHHKSFTKFSVCNDTLESLIKHMSVIYVCDLKKYFDFSFKRIRTFRDLFYFLSKKNITAIGLYRRGDRNIPFYVYTKPSENCELKLDDMVYVL